MDLKTYITEQGITVDQLAEIIDLVLPEFIDIVDNVLLSELIKYRNSIPNDIVNLQEPLICEICEQIDSETVLYNLGIV